MANYGRDTGENYTTAGDIAKIGAGTLVGIVALFAGVNSTKTAKTTKKVSQKQDIEYQIANCDRRINDLSSGLLGSFLNSDEIEAERKKREALQKKLKDM